jgi:hypothetical protein
MGRLLAGTAAVVVGLIVVGALALALFKVLLSAAFYLIVGAVVIGGAVWLYGRTRRGLSGSRNQRRLEATLATWRQRNR